MSSTKEVIVDENSENRPAATSGFNTYPKCKDSFQDRHSAAKWLQALKDEDQVYPYWRIHNKLYDLTEFKNDHPGGRFWIEATQGLDITAAFECSHNSDSARILSEKYFVKDIWTKRTSPFTFEDDGFYRTLKRKTNPILKTIKAGPTSTATVIQDSLFVIFLCLTIWGCYANSFLIIFLAGLVLSTTIVCAHNFFHQKDNFRMYLFDFSLQSYREWRMSHALLHHIYPNTVYDIEMYIMEPFFMFVPNKDKNLYHRFLAMSPLNPVLYIAFLESYIKRIIATLAGKLEFDLCLLIQPALLTGMALITQSFPMALSLWLALHVTCNFSFLWISLTGSHHHYEAVIEGDRFVKDKDWGILQVAATTDRVTTSKYLLLSSMFFGHHTLHHLFPTVDHSKLPYLQDAFQETCKEFGVQFEMYSEWNLVKACFWRLWNTQQNLDLPQKFKNLFSEKDFIPNGKLIS